MCYIISPICWFLSLLTSQSQSQSYNDDYIENCSRAMGDGNSAVGYFDESVNFLSKVGTDDLEVQTISWIFFSNEGKITFITLVEYVYM